MRCIFCKEPSEHVRSVEHIVPESLGNVEQILPCGLVCDKCNQYFARKIERPVLESGMFRLLRHDRRVLNKRGRMPRMVEGSIRELPNFRLMSRLIGKIALEVLAQRTADVDDANKEILEHADLDSLRKYVRFNKGDLWPVAHRTLYPVNSVFKEGDVLYEVLHEYNMLYTESYELYCVVVIFGVEFALNMGGRELDGYYSWLRQNEYSSPLYIGKNA